MSSLIQLLNKFVNDELLTNNEYETLEEAGLIHRRGPYSVTEAGRTLAIKNPGDRRSEEDRRDSDCQPTLTPPPGTWVETSPGFSGHLTMPTQTPEKTARDVQVGGDHYKKLGHHQPWEVLATWMTPEELRGYMKGTVIAYLAREQDKGGDQDIAKALHTMQLWQDVRKDK